MFRRAEDDAKHGRTDQAIAMLKRIVETYKGTTTAGDATVGVSAQGQGTAPLPRRCGRRGGRRRRAQSRASPPPAIVAENPVAAQPKGGNAASFCPSIRPSP